MTPIEKAWGKYDQKLGSRLGPKAKAAIKATFMEGYYEGVKEAAARTRDLAEASSAPVCDAGRAAFQVEQQKRRAKGGA